MKKAVSSAKLGATRGLSVIEEDLQATQGKINQIVTDTAQAHTRIQLLTRQLETLGKRTLAHEDQLARLESEIVGLLKRAGQENETGLNALEQAYLEYQAKASEIRTRKGQILNGRLEAHIYSRRTAEEEKIRELKQELERLAHHALPEEKLREIGTQIEGLERDVRTAGDKVAGLRHEKELLEADQIERKFEEAVTQATIADAKRMENETYAFARGEDRIDFSRRIEKLRADLKTLHTKRAELKVKSDVAGIGQSRIVELKETIATMNIG